ncbi:MAG: efflux RND transporter periplasmic adaptor subunit [Planctomycetia bacterium]|nr:efflux RND transporter periplasmic adaptor subunit [Planctomycetia bacterium]
MNKKLRKAAILIFLLLLIAGAIGAFSDRIRSFFTPQDRPLTLTGNVDDRQVNLAFLVSERVARILPEEGDSVKKGDLLAALETVRIENEITRAKAAVDVAAAAYDKAVNGYRPEEIAMAEAGVRIVKAQIKAAENKFHRNRDLATQSAVSKQDADDAEANYQMLLAELDAAKENLKKMNAGTRSEDVAAARANLDQAKAALAIAQQHLADTKLCAPCDGIIRSRILEPGEMASPQITALELAVVSPKWIRVYLSEPLLPKIKPGDKAVITLDGLPEKTFDGWIGFISPNAEFTPKNVETKELRTSLVYEVRVYLNDPDNVFKLGSPAVVSFPEIMVRE